MGTGTGTGEADEVRTARYVGKPRMPASMKQLI